MIPKLDCESVSIHRKQLFSSTRLVSAFHTRVTDTSNDQGNISYTVIFR